MCLCVGRLIGRRRAAELIEVGVFVARWSLQRRSSSQRGSRDVAFNARLRRDAAQAGVLPR